LQIVIVGKNGQISWELQRTLAVLGEVTAVGRPELDITDLNALRSSLRRLAPDLLVNAAAYTAVDRAESELQTAMKINAEAPAVMADEMRGRGGLFVHYSTDFVYDGRKTTAYEETDGPAPLNAYGASKLAGDQAVTAAAGAHLVFRTSWVYASRGRNFLGTVLRLAAAKNPLRIVNDQSGSPTWSRDIAVATSQVVAQLFEDGADGSKRLRAGARERSGIYHMSADGEVTWHGFASAIMDQLVSSGMERAGLPQVIPISSHEYRAPALRPSNSVLSNEKLKQSFGVRLPDWRYSLARVFEELADDQKLRLPS
jgi:dTDP-4-dehydrorhamnose reductase